MRGCHRGKADQFGVLSEKGSAVFRIESPRWGNCNWQDHRGDFQAKGARRFVESGDGVFPLDRWRDIHQVSFNQCENDTPYCIGGA